jgi:hypothetical protein
VSLASLAYFGNYTPANFGWGARDPEKDSSLLVPFRHSGVSFGSMHRDVVGVFTNVLNELVPYISGGLVAGQCGCYNPKSVTVGGDRSFHTYAIAIDVNWGSNPMGASRRPTGKYALPAITSQIARKWGCEWGGDWTYPQDWMHIEVHLTPAQARAVEANTNGDDDMANSDDILAEIKALRAEVGMTGKVDQFKRKLTVWSFLHSIFSLPDPKDPKILHQYSFDTLIARRTNQVLAAVNALADPQEITAAIKAAFPSGTGNATAEQIADAVVTQRSKRLES